MKIKINGEEIKAEKGLTILEVARREDIKIPSLCNHPDVCVTGSCRICIVKIDGEDGYKTACSTKIYNGMEVITHNSEIEKVRRTNLELIFAQHKEECDFCIWSSDCKLLSLSREYSVDRNKFEDRKKDYPEISFDEIVKFDTSRCIDCRNCVEVCDKQNVSFLRMKNKGSMFEVEPNSDKACVYCGQCINHCPGGAFEPAKGFKLFEKENGDKKIVFQIAPAARASIGEEFGLDPGTVLTEKLISGLRKIGADKVYDVSFGADFTTYEEAKEFLDHFEKGKLPLFTACCPSWVRFVECYYPDFIDNLTAVRSPHIILGGIIKQMANNSSDVVVVSVMPCVSKKYEITREELNINGEKPVDYVLTVREVGRIFRSAGINFKKLENSDFDSPLQDSSRDGLNYGVSGGVMEAALRHAYYMKTGSRIRKKCIKNEKEFSFEIDGKKIRTRKVNGLAEASEVLDKITENPNLYHYVEFMSCEGGCIGGGGQPVPTSKKIRNKRKSGLLKAADQKKNESTFDNREFEKIYDQLSNKKKLFFTTYYKKRKDSQDLKID